LKRLVRQWATKFRQEGYVVLPGFLQAEAVEELRSLASRLDVESDRLRAAAESRSDGPRKVRVHRSLVERAPASLWPVASDNVVIGLLEALIGPFVQIDSAVLVTLPPPPAAQRGTVVEWHRDRLGHVPFGHGYEPPLVIITLAYLQDLSSETGPLRVLPGTHSWPALMPAGLRRLPHPNERLVTAQAGDLLLVHHNLIHSGTHARNGTERSFLGIAYSKSFVKQDDNFAGPNCSALRASAQRRGDRRALRLLGADDLLDQRLNSGFLDPDEQLWEAWRRSEAAARS
jgi:ectoine hydroxylase-related dioxygenase (phytanoyl-CoA dioxygenase family)